MDKNRSTVVDLAAYWGAKYQLTYKGHKSIVGIINLFSLEGIEQAFMGGSRFSFHIELKSLALLTQQDHLQCAVIGGSDDPTFSISLEPFQLWIGPTPASNQGAIIQYLQRKHYYVPGTIDETLIQFILV